MVDLRSLRPLDRPTIVKSVKKTNRAVVLEEDWRSYGIGAEIAATIQEDAFDYLDAPVQRVAAVEVPLPYSKVMELSALPTAQHLVDAIRATLAASGGSRRNGGLVDPGGVAWLKSRCRGSRHDDRGHDREVAQAARATRSRRARSCWRSRPTRRRWS